MVSPTSPHWSPISCVLPSPGRLAPSRAEVCVGSRCVRLVQRFRPSPPSAGLVPCPSTLRFSFPLPFQGLPAPGQMCRVGVLSFFFCVPLFASWLSNSSSHLHGHLTFTPLSSSSSPHLPWHHPAKGRVCVCVYVCVTHLYRCKTSINIDIYLSIYLSIYERGITGVPGGSVINEDTSPGPVQTYPRDCGDAPGRI